MKRGVTLKDLAKELGVSVSAVSKALHNDPGISPVTTARIRQLAEARNYVPNQAAIRLKQSRNFKIGVIIPDLFDQFYALVLRGIEDTAARHQYSVVFTQTHEQPDRERILIDTMIRNRIDGLLISVTTQTTRSDFVEQLEAIGIPVVFVVRSPREQADYSVSANSFEGCRTAITYLVQKGHRRIAHLRGPTTLLLSQERYEGYQQGLRDHQLPFDPELVRDFDETAPNSTEQAIHTLLQLEYPPTAALLYKSYYTLDAITYLQQAYPHLPAPLDLIGFGDLPLFRYIDYRPLAAIDADPLTLGAEAFGLLHQRMTTRAIVAEPHRRMPCQLTIY